MAISRGAGTEIIRTVAVADIGGGADQKIIIGVQHHIYTVLSVVIYCNAVDAADSDIFLKANMYDAKAGASAEMIVFKANLAAGETFVWDNTFSFTGTEPTDFSSPPLSTAAEQDALADQGTTTEQFLFVWSADAGDDYDVYVTFIDQNNA